MTILGVSSTGESITASAIEHGQAPTPIGPGETPPLVDLADTIISWSGLILVGFSLLVTVVALGIGIAGIFGFREIRNARRVINDTQANVTAQLDEARAQSAKIDEIVQGVDQRVEEIVRSSYGYNQGQEAYNEGNYNRAADFFSRACSLQPQSTAIRYRLGRAFTNLDNSARADQEFRRALSEDPNCAEAYRGLALDRRFENLALATEQAHLAVRTDSTDPKIGTA